MLSIHMYKRTCCNISQHSCVHVCTDTSLPACADGANMAPHSSSVHPLCAALRSSDLAATQLLSSSVDMLMGASHDEKSSARVWAALEPFFSYVYLQRGSSHCSPASVQFAGWLHGHLVSKQLRTSDDNTACMSPLYFAADIVR